MRNKYYVLYNLCHKSESSENLPGYRFFINKTVIFRFPLINSRYWCGLSGPAGERNVRCSCEYQHNIIIIIIIISNLSNNRPKASSKTIPPHSAI